MRRLGDLVWKQSEKVEAPLEAAKKGLKELRYGAANDAIDALEKAIAFAERKQP